MMLLPRGVEPDRDLLAALTRRELDVRRCDSALVAFAQLVRHAAEVRDGRASSVGQILLLVEPHKLGDPAGLIRAVEHYAPKVASWLFDASGTPKLRAVQAGDVEAWAERAQARRESADTKPFEAEWATPLRLVAGINGAGSENRAAQPVPERSVAVGPVQVRSAAPASPSSPARATGTLGQLLSSDELAMLLASDRTIGHNTDAGSR